MNSVSNLFPKLFNSPASKIPRDIRMDSNFMWNEYLSRCGFQQVDECVPELEHARVVVLKHNRLTENLVIELPCGPQVLNEKCYCFDPLHPLNFTFISTRSLIHKIPSHLDYYLRATPPLRIA